MSRDSRHRQLAGADRQPDGGEAGTTLVEVSVAMVLLVVVLVPTVMVVIGLANSPDARHRSEAMSRAQVEMETVMEEASRAEIASGLRSRGVEDGLWRVERTVERVDETTVLVQVDVSRAGEGARRGVLASLETTRFIAPPSERLPEALP